jgi:hypothetical protein
MSRNFTPDETLIDRLLLNDTEAFEELYHRYCFYLYTYCMDKLDSPEDSRRIVGRIFIDLWENRHSLPVRFSISMHLYSGVRKAVVQCINEKLEGRAGWPALEKQILPGFQVMNPNIRLLLSTTKEMKNPCGITTGNQSVHGCKV